MSGFKVVFKSDMTTGIIRYILPSSCCHRWSITTETPETPGRLPCSYPSVLSPRQQGKSKTLVWYSVYNVLGIQRACSDHSAIETADIHNIFSLKRLLCSTSTQPVTNLHSYKTCVAYPDYKMCVGFREILWTNCVARVHAFNSCAILLQGVYLWYTILFWEYLYMIAVLRRGREN